MEGILCTSSEHYQESPPCTSGYDTKTKRARRRVSELEKELKELELVLTAGSQGSTQAPIIVSRALTRVAPHPKN